jgi:hypothetical protein
MEVKGMVNEVKRFGRLYVEQIDNGLDFMIVDYKETSYAVSAITCVLNLQQVVELKQLVDSYLKDVFAKKYCFTCANFEGGCRLDADQRYKCIGNGKSFYVPKATR